MNNYFYSQSLRGIVSDSLNQEFLPFANVLLLNGKGTFTDAEGKFIIDIKNNIDDTLKISAYGYEPTFFPLNKIKNKTYINFNLVPKISNIEEVVISSKKILFNRKAIIGEDRIGNISVTSLIGYETCVYLNNYENIIGKISSIFVDLKKRNNADLTCYFRIKFYEYDSENDKPGKELSNKNIISYPKNAKYRLKIDVKDYNIIFPKNGICIGIEMIYPNNNYSQFAKFGPAFRYTLSNSKKSITWSNYHNKGWVKSDFKVPNLKTNYLEYSNPMLGIEVLYPNNKN